MNIEFTIPGTPVAKGRPRFARRGAFVTTYSPEKTVSYENLVKVMASQAMSNSKPFEGAVYVAIELRILPPASWSKKKRALAFANTIYPTGKPDLDNVAKIILDGMNGIVFIDDKQAIGMHVNKYYGEIAYAFVKVKHLEAN